MGSAVSYARRYALMAALGLATGIQELDEDDDDDGEVNGLLDDLSLADLEAKCKQFKTLVSLNAWINQINPQLHRMSEKKPDDYNRFYAVWKQHEETLAQPPIEKGDR